MPETSKMTSESLDPPGNFPIKINIISMLVGGSYKKGITFENFVTLKNAFLKKYICLQHLRINILTHCNKLIFFYF